MTVAGNADCYKYENEIEGTQHTDRATRPCERHRRSSTQIAPKESTINPANSKELHTPSKPSRRKTPKTLRNRRLFQLYHQYTQSFNGDIHIQPWTTKKALTTVPTAAKHSLLSTKLIAVPAHPTPLRRSTRRTPTSVPAAAEPGQQTAKQRLATAPRRSRRRTRAPFAPTRPTPATAEKNSEPARPDVPKRIMGPLWFRQRGITVTFVPVSRSLFRSALRMA